MIATKLCSRYDIYAVLACAKILTIWWPEFTAMCIWIVSKNRKAMQSARIELKVKLVKEYVPYWPFYEICGTLTANEYEIWMCVCYISSYLIPCGVQGIIVPVKSWLSDLSLICSWWTTLSSLDYDDVIIWKRFAHYLPFMMGIPQSPMVPSQSASYMELWGFFFCFKPE